MYKHSSLLACWVIVHAFLLSADFCLSKSTFSKIYFRNTIRLSNSLDQDQAQQKFGPDRVQTVCIRDQQTTPVSIE